MKEFIEVPATEKSLSSRKLVYGVGVNDADYMVCKIVGGKQIKCPYYTSWKSALMRCYGKKYQEKNPSYVNCSVCKEWMIFSSFRSWMIRQDWVGKHLDKDLIVIGNKIYSPDTCVFIGRELNNLLTDHAIKRGDYPQGVSFDKSSGKYLSLCRINGRQKNLGRFNEVKDAESAYLEFKSNVIKSIALGYKMDSKRIIYNALIRHADKFDVMLSKLRIKQ